MLSGRLRVTSSSCWQAHDQWHGVGTESERGFNRNHGNPSRFATTSGGEGAGGIQRLVPPSPPLQMPLLLCTPLTMDHLCCGVDYYKEAAQADVTR